MLLEDGQSLESYAAGFSVIGRAQEEGTTPVRPPRNTLSRRLLSDENLKREVEIYGPDSLARLLAQGKISSRTFVGLRRLSVTTAAGARFLPPAIRGSFPKSLERVLIFSQERANRIDILFEQLRDGEGLNRRLIEEVKVFCAERSAAQISPAAVVYRG